MDLKNMMQLITVYDSLSKNNHVPQNSKRALVERALDVLKLLEHKINESGGNNDGNNNINKSKQKA